MFGLPGGGGLLLGLGSVDFALQGFHIADERAFGKARTHAFDDGERLVRLGASIGKPGGDEVDLDHEIVVLSSEERQAFFGGAGCVLTDHHLAVGSFQIHRAIGIDPPEGDARAGGLRGARRRGRFVRRGGSWAQGCGCGNARAVC